MCYRPLTFRNPTNDIVPTDSINITVACNDCEECRKHKKNEMVLRTFEQMLDCRKRNELQGFFTLTYNMENQPYFDAAVGNDSVHIPCFSPEDIKNFRKTLQNKLNDDYGIKGMTYLICGEYGSHTQKPHYHCHISVPRVGELTPRLKKRKGYKDESELPVLDAKTLHSLILQTWNKGFIFPATYLGGVDSNGYNHKPFEISGDVTGAASYIAKYTCKDLEYFKIPQVQKLKAAWYKKKGQHSKWKEFLKVASLRRNSQGFGACIVNKVLKSENPIETIKNGFVSLLYSTHTVPVPAYCVRKLTHTCEYIKDDAAGFIYRKPKIRYALTELGKEVYKDRIKSQVKRLTESYEEFFKESEPYLNCEALAIYSVIYRNRMNPRANVIRDAFNVNLTPSDFFTGHESLQRMINKAYDYKFAHLDYVRKPSSSKMKYDIREHEKIGQRFNDFECFYGFDDYVDMYNAFKNKQKEEELEYKAAEDRHLSYLKQKYSHSESYEYNNVIPSVNEKYVGVDMSDIDFDILFQ